MQLIDTHAHIYLPEFDNDRVNIIENARMEGIDLIFMPAIDSKTHEAMIELEQQYSSCKSMMGLHPCSILDKNEEELNIVEQWLSKRKFIAIGEIGLDFYWDRTFIDQQYNTFHHQIGLAINHRLPIVIHSRNAIDECIGVIKQYPGLTGVFHCFSGNLHQAEQIIQNGFLLGIGGVVTYKNAGLDKVIQHISLNSLVLETDAPYLAPVPFRGKRNESSYLTYIAKKMAGITNKQMEEVALVTTQNAMKLFKLP
ncbi:MAG: TatD family hydrolase [Bacteroidota bacterium]|nr:TatD family hydrolase [Bacteroidota bacterium]